ncbi:phosphoglycerate kinase, partial [Haematococcus lacustris]
MALSMKCSMASRVGGARVANHRAAFSGPRIARVAQPAPVSVRQPLASRVQRASAVTVRAVKVSVGDLKKADLEGKRVFVRADLNVPMDKAGNVTDDTRIRAAIPTLKYLLDNGAKVLLTSHLGRPKGENKEEDKKKYSLKPVVARLSELLGKPVTLVDDCIGPQVESAVATLHNGDVALLENVRFYKQEEKNDADFAKAKELDYLDGAIKAPKKPFVAIVGGSKVSTKITVVESLMEAADKVIIGGGMIFTFYKARGLKVGSSLVEDDKMELAKKLEAMAKAKGCELLLPTDVVVADKFDANANTQTVSIDAIPDGWMGLDIGPDSVKLFQDALAGAKTVVWNGPMGVFEMPKFAAGTVAIANTMAGLTGEGCITIIGGGDSVAAAEQAGVADRISHISTGGGASLELLEGKVLPGVAALDEKTA